MKQIPKRRAIIVRFLEPDLLAAGQSSSNEMKTSMPATMAIHADKANPACEPCRKSTPSKAPKGWASPTRTAFKTAWPILEPADMTDTARVAPIGTL